jgi:hypothetical protein
MRERSLTRDDSSILRCAECCVDTIITEDADSGRIRIPLTEYSFMQSMRITLDRESELNALNLMGLQQVHSALSRAQAKIATSTVVIDGVGAVGCALEVTSNVSMYGDSNASRRSQIGLGRTT